MYESLELEELDTLYEDPEEMLELGDFTGESAYEVFEEEDSPDYYEFEDDPEADPFFGGVFPPLGGRIAKRLHRRLRKMARRAARVAGASVLGPMGGQLAGRIANQVIREAEMDFEAELDPEGDFEAEFASLGGDPEILMEMEYYANLAAETESEAEADQFFGALASLAGQLLPTLLPALMGETGDYEDYEFDGELDYELYEDDEAYYEDEADLFLPALGAIAANVLPIAAKVLPKALPFIRRGIGAIGRLFRSSGASSLVRKLPRMAAGMVMDVAKQAGRRRLSPQQIAALMARRAARTVANPRRISTAFRPARYRRRRRIIRPRYCVY